MAGGLPTQCSLRGVGGWPTQRGFRCVGILSARKNTRVPRFWPLLPDVGIFVCTDKNFVRARIHPPIMHREPPPLPRRIHIAINPKAYRQSPRGNPAFCRQCAADSIRSLRPPVILSEVSCCASAALAQSKDPYPAKCPAFADCWNSSRVE